jgi:hypothetical protein
LVNKFSTGSVLGHLDRNQNVNNGEFCRKDPHLLVKTDIKISGYIRLLENQLSSSSVLRPPESLPAGGVFIGSFCCISQHLETGSAVQVAEGCQKLEVRAAGGRSYF